MVAALRDTSARLREATERAMLETRVRQWQKFESLGALAGGVAHDLNNLLGPVVAYPDLLLEMVPPDGELAEIVQEMRDAALLV